MSNTPQSNHSCGIHRLERENLWLKRTLMLFAVGALIFAVTGAKRDDVPKVLEAERFVLRDGDHRIRAILGVRPDNWVELRLNGEDGKCRLALGVDPDGRESRLEIADAKSSGRIQLGVLPDQSVGQSFFDPDGKRCLEFNAQENHAEGIAFFGHNERLQMAIGLPDPNEAEVTLFDRQGRKRLALNVDQENAPNVILSGESNQKNMIMKVSKNAIGLNLTDSKGKDRLTVGVLGPKELSVIKLSDQEEKIKIGLGVENDGTADLKVYSKNGESILSPSKK